MEERRDTLMSASQAAEYLGISRVRINQLAGAGKLERVEVGGYYLYRQSELDRWRATPKSLGGRPKEDLKVTMENRTPALATS